ncbi:cysteine-rich receptor-like protein kinase, partial [Trifolium medium]|nr:cysteine-rich receptor-like protein kinase [Trifolium medium]
SDEERRSASDGHRSADVVPFNRFIDDNNLIDLPLCGRKYTWFRGDGLSMSRLDRFLLSGEWCLAWPNCTQVARMRGLSDHCPLVLSASEEDWGPRPLRMLKCWKDVPGYNLFVKNKWNSFQVDGWGGYVLKEKFKMIKSALKEWHTTHTQNLPSRIESLKDRLATLDEKGGEEDLSEAELAELHGVTSDIHSLSRLNASICWQQSRSQWLKEGDANTKYFHSILASRRRGNAISSLQVGLNATFIALIPKVDSPQRLNDFRPISLVSSLYKILAKVLANRLRLVMGSVISESQTAFVKDRQILDGILIANEVVDEARRSKKELMLFKVDFEKAYDSVDWGYLDDVMGRMGFPTLWRKWIRECVCTATTSVLVNESPTDEFPLERGLRQGDPLSPFLFLLAAEGFHVLMEAMVERKLFTGYSVGESNPVEVSHLQFADDTLLMGTKSWANVRALRAVLVLFETMSGLKVNFNK